MIKPLPAQLQGDVGKGQVAGILQGLGGLFRPVAGGAPTVEQLGSARDLLGPPAVEGGIQVNGPAVQGRRHGQHLKGGARLIAVGEHPVAPLFEPGPGQGFFVGPGFLGIFGAIHRELCITFLLGLQCPAGLRVIDLLIIVGVKAPQGGHGQDFPGFAVHHQAEGPVLDIVAVHSGLELFFKAGLHGGIQGQDHAAPRMGGGEVFIGIGHIHFVVALCCNDLSGLAGEEPVIGRLDALAALPGTVGKADDLAGKASEGIGPQSRRF